MGGSGLAAGVMLAPAGFAGWVLAKQVTWLRANNVPDDLISAVEEGFPYPEETDE